MQSIVQGRYNAKISLSKINNLKPFFLKNPTEKKILCMCKLCLNTRLKFDVIMLHQKENGGATFSSGSNFLMNT